MRSRLRILQLHSFNLEPLHHHPIATLTLRRVWLQVAMKIKVDAIAPINILFIGGGKFWSLLKIKLMLLPQWTYYSEEVAFFNVMMMMMMMTVMMMVMMMMMMMMIMIMTIVSVEQRPGWSEHIEIVTCWSIRMNGEWFLPSYIKLPPFSLVE